MDPWKAYGELGDGLLFACLFSVAQGKEFQVEAARDEAGRWYRNPTLRENRILGPRDSTISRDMFMGLLLYCLVFKRLDILDALWSYGWKNFWKMGEENRTYTFWKFSIRDNRTWFVPGLIALLGWIRAHLQGKATLWRYFPQVYSTEPGYTSHLSLLHILMSRIMAGKLTAGQQLTLNKIERHMSMNPLVYALKGDKIKTFTLLESIWPKDRLPTKEDWTEEWRLQRSDGDSGFNGEPGNKTQHTGGDYLFVIKVLELCRTDLTNLKKN